MVSGQIERNDIHRIQFLSFQKKLMQRSLFINIHQSILFMNRIMIGLVNIYLSIYLTQLIFIYLTLYQFIQRKFIIKFS